LLSNRVNRNPEQLRGRRNLTLPLRNDIFVSG